MCGVYLSVFSIIKIISVCYAKSVATAKREKRENDHLQMERGRNRQTLATFPSNFKLSSYIRQHICVGQVMYTHRHVRAANTSPGGGSHLFSASPPYVPNAQLQ